MIPRETDSHCWHQYGQLGKTTTMTTYSFCLYGLFFLRLLQVRPVPSKYP